MDMAQVNAAVEGEKNRAQTARIEAALTDLVKMVKELKAEVAELKSPRPSLAPENTKLQAAKRLGESKE